MRLAGEHSHVRAVQYTRALTGRQTDALRWNATTRLAVTVYGYVRDMSANERRPPHLHECLWRYYFRTRNIVTLLSPVYLYCS